MSGYAWLGVIASTFVSTLSIAGYVVMVLPYFDDMPHLTDLKKNTKFAFLAGSVLFVIMFVIFYLSALYLDQDTSGPLLLFAAFIAGLPVSLLLGTETWDRRNGHGMNQVSAGRAVAVATGIGLAELAGFSLFFMFALQIMA
jgi:O-antigen/teichoic acid export membrane protein